MSCLTKILAALAALLACAAACGQPYSSRPVKLVVPFAAGGPADVYARFLAQRMQEAMGQPFVVDHRPGAGSIIGTDAVAKSAPDGYTLLVMSNTHTVNESLVPNKPYVIAPKGTPVAIINRLNAEITRIVNRPDVRAEWQKQGAEPMAMTPDEFGRFLVDDIAKWARIVKISGAKPDQ